MKLSVLGGDGLLYRAIYRWIVVNILGVGAMQRLLGPLQTLLCVVRDVRCIAYFGGKIALFVRGGVFPAGSEIC